MKYDKRSFTGNIAYITFLGYRVSTLQKCGRRGKVTTYYMIEIPSSSPVFIYKLIDAKSFIKDATRGLFSPPAR